MEYPKNIVICGGGFAGIAAALLLEKKLHAANLDDQYSVLVIDKTPYHVYTPGLYEIAAFPRGIEALQKVKSSIAIPLADIFRNTTNILWREETIQRFDTKNKTVVLENGGTIPYDTLLIALGAETNYFNIPGLQEYSFPLKTFGDAIRLRDAVESAVLSKKDRIDIVIGGAGATGVEVAAESENFICKLRDMYRPEYMCDIHVTLLQASPVILPGFDPWIVNVAAKRLIEIGITIKTNATVASVSKTSVKLADGTSLPYTIFLWAGGITAPDVLKTLDLPISPKGGLNVDKYLKADRGIYAIGDNANFSSAPKGLPENVLVAETEAAMAVHNIIAELSKKPLKIFEPRKKYPFVLALGNMYAAADLIFIRFAGLTGWVVKQFIELRYLCSILPLKKAFAIWFRFLKIERTNDTDTAITKQAPRSASR